MVTSFKFLKSSPGFWVGSVNSSRTAVQSSPGTSQLLASAVGVSVASCRALPVGLARQCNEIVGFLDGVPPKRDFSLGCR